MFSQGLVREIFRIQLLKSWCSWDNENSTWHYPRIQFTYWSFLVKYTSKYLGKWFNDIKTNTEQAVHFVLWFYLLAPPSGKVCLRLAGLWAERMPGRAGLSQHLWGVQPEHHTVRSWVERAAYSTRLFNCMLTCERLCMLRPRIFNLPDAGTVLACLSINKLEPHDNFPCFVNPWRSGNSHVHGCFE